MAHSLTFVIIGGDRRSFYAAKRLEEYGFETKLFGLEKEETYNPLKKIQADAVLLPIPFTRDGVHLFAPESMEKILISAAKQSLKATVPILNELCSINDVVKNRKEEYSFIAHCYKQEKNDFLKICPKQKSILILIGPEGDFSQSEVENAIDSGFCPVSLGESRLRTETAGIVACHIANLVQNI